MANIAGKDNLDAANTVFVTEFGDVFGEVGEGIWPMLVEEVQLDGLSMELILEDDLSEVREWVEGETKKYDGERAYSVAYSTKTHYMAKELPRKRVTLDKTGATGQSLRRFLQRARPMLDKVVMDRLTSNPTGYDGVSLISASHPNGPNGTTQSNSTSNPISDSEFESGIAAMRSLQRENGDYYDMSPTHLIVHPDDERRARELAQADERPVAVGDDGTVNPGGSNGTGAAAITNVYRGIVDVLVSPRLTSGDWLLADLGKPGIRPWIIGFARRPEPIEADSMDDSERRNRDVFQWAIETDLAHGPGHWQCLYGRLQ